MTARTKPAQAAATFDETLFDVVAELRARVLRFAENLAGGLKADDLADRLDAFDTEAAHAAANAARDVVATITRLVASAQTNDGRPEMIAKSSATRVDAIFKVAWDNAADQSVTQARQAAQRAVDKIRTRQAESLAELRAAVDRGDIDTVMRVRPLVEVTLPTELDAARLVLLEAEVDVAAEAADKADAITVIADKHFAAAIKQVDETRTAQEAALAAASAMQGSKQVADFGAREMRGYHRNAIEARNQLASSIEAERTARFRRLAGLPDSDYPSPPNPSIPVDPMGTRRQPTPTPANGGISVNNDFDRTPFTPTKFGSVADLFVSGG